MGIAKISIFSFNFLVSTKKMVIPDRLQKKKNNIKNSTNNYSSRRRMEGFETLMVVCSRGQLGHIYQTPPSLPENIGAE